MKQSAKVAFCGCLSAAAVVIMLVAYFPYVTYAVPAVAGIALAIITIETNRKWAIASYITISIISLLICEKEAACLFVGFFGFYTILKGVIEQRLLGMVEYIIKHLIFSASVIISYLVIVFVFGIPFFDGGDGGTIFASGLLVAGNVVFHIYDRGLTRLIGAYIGTFHPKIQRMFK